ncbi:hypothetical protein GTY86_27895 [Streptomyces sp. SID5770]|uniref:hypothetical protein n=1 Tax=Streptomyces sp. SID5770 TaxID=2690308 RepID=UPI00136F563F|nr:hypothetical protein [Streptomyces sp. SID5770]MZE55032.1 hypothetical protein [Streptomyces sp. SID5770]
MSDTPQNRTDTPDGGRLAVVVRTLGGRGLVLAVLGAITVGVAVLSVVVNYRILEDVFGSWAYAIVFALDALWVIFQASEILAGSNKPRALRARIAGLVLTAGLTAVPTIDMVLHDRYGIAVVLTPAAIVGTKLAWTIALPSLGRRVSEETRRKLADRRQQVADRLEVMEAEAAHRIEVLEVTAGLEARVAAAETAYRASVLKSQAQTARTLRDQSEETGEATADPLPVSVTSIRLPELDGWTPFGLPGTAPARAVTQVSALPLPPGTGDGTAAEEGGTPPAQGVDPEGLADLAAVAGVPVPVPGEALTDDQVTVVLRHLRYSDDPPLSYRQARDRYRSGGYIGSEERIRRLWGDVVAAETAETGTTGAAPVRAEDDGADDDEESSPSRPAGDDEESSRQAGCS